VDGLEAVESKASDAMIQGEGETAQAQTIPGASVPEKSAVPKLTRKWSQAEEEIAKLKAQNASLQNGLVEKRSMKFREEELQNEEEKRKEDDEFLEWAQEQQKQQPNPSVKLSIGNMQDNISTVSATSAETQPGTPSPKVKTSASTRKSTAHTPPPPPPKRASQLKLSRESRAGSSAGSINGSSREQRGSRNDDFFKNLKTQREASAAAEKQRRDELPESEREALERKEREEEEHQKNKSEMLRRQMGAFNGHRSKIKSKSKGGKKSSGQGRIVRNSSNIKI